MPGHGRHHFWPRNNEGARRHQIMTCGGLCSSSASWQAFKCTRASTGVIWGIAQFWKRRDRCRQCMLPGGYLLFLTVTLDFHFRLLLLLRLAARVVGCCSICGRSKAPAAARAPATGSAFSRAVSSCLAHVAAENWYSGLTRQNGKENWERKRGNGNEKGGKEKGPATPDKAILAAAPVPIRLMGVLLLPFSD